MKAFIFDTETTGFKDPDVLQLAYTEPYAWGNEDITCHILYFNTLKPIDWGAMATHHILRGYEGSHMWPGSWAPPAEAEYAIGHHVDFDAGVVKLPDSMKRICTMHLARKQFPALDSHTLGALSYYDASLSGELKTAEYVIRHAHNAATDVQLTYKVLLRLLTTMPEVQCWEQLYQRSEAARVPERMTFGKYGPDSDWGKANGGFGMLCRQVRDFDYNYFRWLLNNCDRVINDPYLRKALVGS